jgi:hypothetical protein
MRVRRHATIQLRNQIVCDMLQTGCNCLIAQPHCDTQVWTAPRPLVIFQSADLLCGLVLALGL